MPFRNPIVAGEELVIPAIRSEGYQEALSGWRLAGNGAAQFGNAQILGDAGIQGSLSANQIDAGPGGVILADGSDVGARLDALETLTMSTPTNPLPGQAVRIIQFPINEIPLADQSMTNGEKGILELDTGFLGKTGWYEVNLSPILFTLSAATATIVYMRVRWTVTTDGITTPPSPLIADAPTLYERYLPIASTGAFALDAYFARYLNAGYRYRILFSFGVASNLTISMVNTGLFASSAFKYLGDMTNNSNQYGALGVGYGLNTGGATTTSTPPPAPVTAQKRVKTFYSTWSQSYDQNAAKRLGDANSPYCYQGYYSGTHGNTASLVGFDWQTIQNELFGATNVSVTFTFTPAHVWASSGGTAIIGAHWNAGMPATLAAYVADQTRKSIVSGKTYTISMPSIYATKFKDGTWKGIAFGPAPTLSTAAYYAYMYGATQTSRPYLTFTYWK